MAAFDLHSEVALRAIPRISEPPPSTDEDPSSSRMRREVGRAAVALSRSMADALSSYATLHGQFDSLRARLVIAALDDTLDAIRALEGAVRALRSRLTERVDPPVESP
jgi:hypothetical protein